MMVRAESALCKSPYGRQIHEQWVSSEAAFERGSCCFGEFDAGGFECISDTHTLPRQRVLISTWPVAGDNPAEPDAPKRRGRPPKDKGPKKRAHCLPAPLRHCAALEQMEGARLCSALRPLGVQTRCIASTDVSPYHCHGCDAHVQRRAPSIRTPPSSPTAPSASPRRGWTKSRRTCPQAAA